MLGYIEAINRLKNSDAIIITASNGFSISEGLNIFANDEKFHDLFPDLLKKHPLQNLLHGYFYDWPNENDKWVFFSRMISYYNDHYKGSILTDALKDIIRNKPYFIVTSNGENHFELAGFDPENILEIEGSWKTMRCVNKEHSDVYPTYEFIKKMHESEKDGKIPEDLIPYCPICHSPMKINMQPDIKTYENFQKFAATYRTKKVTVLELGIGPKNQFIKAPLMNYVYNCDNATYITINKGELAIPEEILDRSLGLNGLLNEILPNIAKCTKA